MALLLFTRSRHRLGRVIAKSSNAHGHTKPFRHLKQLHRCALRVGEDGDGPSTKRRASSTPRHHRGAAVLLHKVMLLCDAAASELHALIVLAREHQVLPAHWQATTGALKSMICTAKVDKGAALVSQPPLLLPQPELFAAMVSVRDELAMVRSGGSANTLTLMREPPQLKMGLSLSPSRGLSLFTLTQYSHSTHPHLHAPPHLSPPPSP